MFRLVKVLNANNQCETVKLNSNASLQVGKGCGLTYTNGALAFPTAAQAPDYIALIGSDEIDAGEKIDVMIVTENMVFKVEYSGSVTPFVGMPVGLATVQNKMDAVTYNSGGKGIVIGVEDDRKSVYVRFNK